MLTDLELSYTEHLALKMHENQQTTQLDKDELVFTWYTKVLHTLRVLMSLLGLEFHF